MELAGQRSLTEAGVSSVRARGAAVRRVLGCAVLAITLLIAPAARAASPALQAAKKCRSVVSAQGRSYAKKRLQYLLGCVDKLLACEILLEVDGTNAASCRSKAVDSCTAKIGPAADATLSRAAASFDAKAGLACTPMGLPSILSTAAGGLWFGNDGTCSGAGDLAALLVCLRGEIETRVDGLVSQVKPRAGLLLDNAGLGGGFPALVRPPVVAQVVSATAPGSGTLVDPGTINLPAGSALELSGDAATLPCGGGGNNGRLTITVGSQERSIKEPYGASEVALFGPYTATAVIPYTLALKDGQCQDTVTNNVEVP